MKTKKSEKNYRIFRVDSSDKSRLLPKKITMVRINAKDDNDAYEQLKTYIKCANKEYKYYVEKWQPYVVVRNGKKYYYDNAFEAWQDDVNHEAWYTALWNTISSLCWRYFIDIPMDCWRWCRDLMYLIKYKQQYQASWNIDNVLLETLKFNLPILKKYKHTLSWAMLEKAYLEKHSDASIEDAKKYFSTHFNGYEKDVEERAVELEREMFDKLIDDINAYKYYMGGYEDFSWYGDIDKEDMEKTDKKLRNTLPLIKGSYNNYDHNKLNALSEKYWNRIWDTVRKYGREFND